MDRQVGREIQIYECECVCFTSSASRHLPMDIQVVSVSCAKSLQSCLTFCDLTDCSPPDSSFHGILQARILEQIAVAFSSFLVLAIINSADMKSGCVYLFELEFLPFLNIHPGVGLLNHMGALFLVFFFFIYFYQLEANYFTILYCILSYIDMNQPRIYMYSPSRSPLPPPSPPDPSGSSQCTRPEHLSHASNLGW